MEGNNMTHFTEIINRTGTRSFKWDHRKAIFHTDDVLPMWVADMDFRAPNAVNEALKERAEHGVYGYTVIDDEVKKSVIDWVQYKHHWTIDIHSLSFSPGVITSLHTAIQQFTAEGDRIVIQTPVYTPFFNLIRGSNREVVESPLVYDGSSYTIDFTAFENILKKDVKAFILCSPHNPVGRVWTKEELTEIVRLCEKYDVLIFSDEIHADLVFNSYTHIPIASLSEEAANRTITFMSPTKTFNLAGLQASFIVTLNERMKRALDAELGQRGFNMLNTMGVLALEAAYKHGAPWLDELMDVIEENKSYVINELEAKTNGKIRTVESEATYLLWLDCHNLQLDDASLQSFFIEKAKVGLNAGVSYGKDGKQFMRMNIACPRKTVEEGVQRIIRAVNEHN